ncbi:acyltransferase [Pseudomonas purpurea]|uniref:acyltransferase family protein n=1 Tax=Pseudomonas purpurea TaxID=3136737 RepID=UPI00326600BD
MGTYRLILALLVLVSHMGLTVLGLNPGVVAVISFFMLSGYVMTALIKRYYLAPRSIPDFYLDRLMRLQPQYLFYLTLSVIYFFAADVHDFFVHAITWQSLILNALIVPNSFYMTPLMADGVIIPPAWSLGLEACFYLVIPFLLIYRLRWLAFGSSLVVFLFAYSTTINTDWFGYRLLPGTLFMFLLGSFLYEKGRRERLAIVATCGLCCALLVATLVFGVNRVPFNAEVLLGVVVGVPMIFLLAQRSSGRLDQLLGNISYGVFLNHFLLIWVWRTFGMTTPTHLDMLTLMAASMALGWVSYRLVEKPAIALRSRLRKRMQASASASAARPTAFDQAPRPD